MKKISSFFVVIAVLCVAMFSLVGCGGGNENVIRISEVTHSLFYAPFYAAINKGYFKEYNIEIDLNNAGGSDGVMTALISNSADVGLMGPESVVFVNNKGMANAPVIFAQLTACDGSFLVGRNAEEVDNFDWSNLQNKHIIAGRKAGMPAMTLQYILNEMGLTTGLEDEDVDVILDTSIPFNLNTPTFISGTGDYCTMFEPTASQCVEDGTGYIVSALGEKLSNVPYTCFTASSKFLNNNNEKLTNFVKALKKGYDFVISASDSELIEALKPSFKTTKDSLIISAVRNYLRIGAYAESCLLGETAWEQMLDIIDNAGELKARVNYTTAVNTQIATNALSA